MTDSNETEQPKKISLQDAIKQKLANKKNEQSNNNKSNTNSYDNKKTMKSQQSKKTSMTRRKVGG